MSGEMDGLGMPINCARMFCEAAQWAAEGLEALRDRLREENRVREALGRWETIEDMLVDADYAESTARKYARCVHRFLARRGISPVAADPTDVRDFLAFRESLGKGTADRRLHLAAIRTVFDRLLGLHVTDGVEYPPRPPRRPAARPDEVTQLSDAVEDVREEILIAFLYHDKLRPAHIASANWSDLTPDLGTMDVQWNTTGKRRSVRISAQTRALLQQARVSQAGAAIFHSTGHQCRNMTVNGLAALLGRIAARAGLKITCTAIRMCDAPLTS